jgi:hypothetical protein
VYTVGELRIDVVCRLRAELVARYFLRGELTTSRGAGRPDRGGDGRLLRRQRVCHGFLHDDCEHLAVPFQTSVLGVDVTVTDVELAGDDRIVGRYTLAMLFEYGLPVANAELSTNIYLHAGHGLADDLRASSPKISVEASDHRKRRRSMIFRWKLPVGHIAAPKAFIDLSRDEPSGVEFVPR